MAAVFVPPSPQASVTMSTRRAPLANVPNGTNSPRRGAHLAPKRPHPGNSQLENAGFQEPPPKRQVLDQEDVAPRSPLRKAAQPTPDSKLFTRKNENVPPSAFERKLVAARDKDRLAPQRQSNGTKNTKVAGDSMESIRQWQKHYRKAFPQFVFYFESVPDDIRYKFSKQVKQLGAVSFLLVPFITRVVRCSSVYHVYAPNLVIDSLTLGHLFSLHSMKRNFSQRPSPMSLLLAPFQ